MKYFIQIIFFIIYFHVTRINEELKILFKHGTGKQ
jgi:hypothetical protein